MKMQAWIGGVAISLAALLMTAGAGAAAEQAVKLYVPYSKLTDLSEDQKKQISAIEADYRARIKQLETEKDAKITALLTDAQNASLGKLGEADKAKRKAYYDKKKETKAAEKSKEQAK